MRFKKQRYLEHESPSFSDNTDNTRHSALTWLQRELHSGKALHQALKSGRAIILKNPAWLHQGDEMRSSRSHRAWCINYVQEIKVDSG